MNINKKGGIDPKTPEETHRAKEADLITLPQEIRGTNCFNCRFIRQMNGQAGFCVHPKVQQSVNGRMCCALWDRDGSIRPWQK
jgi:hypothetical protein